MASTSHSTQELLIVNFNAKKLDLMYKFWACDALSQEGRGVRMWLDIIEGLKKKRISAEESVTHSKVCLAALDAAYKYALEMKAFKDFLDEEGVPWNTGAPIMEQAASSSGKSGGEEK